MPRPGGALTARLELHGVTGRPCPLAAAECMGLLSGGQGWQPVKIVSELDGSQSFALFESR